jgi:hypothetical protein
MPLPSSLGQQRAPAERLAESWYVAHRWYKTFRRRCERIIETPQELTAGPGRSSLEQAAQRSPVGWHRQTREVSLGRELKGKGGRL